jgi:hypothetical protein
MKPLKLISLGVGFLLVSCATTGAGESAQDAVAGPIDCSSYRASDAPLVFHAMDPNVPAAWPTQRIVVPAGVTIPISVGHFDPRQGIEPVPVQCMDFQISPSAAARISQDGLSIEIGEDAQPGSDIQLTGTLRGSRRGEGSETLRIVIIDEITRQLIGTWSFDEARGCEGTQVDPPLEIRFEVNNGLSVTWTPFGRYWDYWGRYAWSPDSGEFSFEATDGNRIPSDISPSGQLVQEGDRHLVFSGFHFGTRESGASAPGVSAAEAGCALVFRRQGAAPQ